MIEVLPDHTHLLFYRYKCVRGVALTRHALCITLVNVYVDLLVFTRIGSILLNIHEVWPRLFWGGSSHQKKNTVDHFIGHIPFASLEGDKRPDKINQKSRELEHFMP